MPRTLQRGQLRRHKKKPPANPIRDGNGKDKTTPWLTPFKAFLIGLVAVAGLIHVIEVPPVSIHIRANTSGTNGDKDSPPGEEAQQQQQEEKETEAPTTEPPKSKVVGPLLTEDIKDPWKREAYRRLDRIREECGSLCGINDMDAYKAIGVPNEGTDYSTFQIPVDCQTLFELDEHDDEDKSVPFPIPEELEPFFSLDGAIKINNWKRFQGPLPIPDIDMKQLGLKLGGRAFSPTWTAEEIDRGVQLLMHGELKGGYGTEETNRVFNKLKEQGGLQDKTVLVVGSESSWLETVAIASGASSVLTVEYAKITSLHPKLKTMTPSRFRRAYLAGELPKFDAVLSYSSLDHSGLGRYEDALNPWGDIISLARFWCTTREDGMLMLALPTGTDEVRYNAHRIYGNIRWPLMTTNWQSIDQVDDFSSKQEGKGEAKDEAIHFFRKFSPA